MPEVEQQLQEDTSKVLLAGPAAAAGRLPDVLMVTFPARFATMTSARKGEQQQHYAVV
jgi:hypothetical protein